MTAYSGSRGIMYTSPPTETDTDEEADVSAEANEPAAADD